MIQYLIAIVIIVISAVYIALKIKNAGDDYKKSKCGSCRNFDACAKDIKKSRH
ncbi:MAG: hypothetical protein KKD38_09735 [Candidatus Delongbacteria bacterium]|nr:hypothetical protein [Candidatus Delongbacteria bacterium]MCG2761503.1 hypothetical protein [Candidatus Delongbacteria bacterium]